MLLQEKIRKICDDEATLYGFADIHDFKESIFDKDLRKYPRAVSIGIKIPDNIIENIDNLEGQIMYEKTYNALNSKLNELADKIVENIQNYGYDAVGVFSSYILPDSNLHGSVSHKFIANLAGLGWIGKSCLLITPEYGPRLRWASVLTDAPLLCHNNRLENKCGDCRICVDDCPAGAFKNVLFDEDMNRSSRYDAFACFKHFEELEKDNHPRLCGICVNVCPWGRKNSLKKG